MSLRNLVWFYRRRVRARAVQELFALAGIAVGVALLFAVLVSSSSLSASVAELGRGIQGDAQWQLLARGPQGMDEKLLAEVEALPGVEVAAPTLEAQANAVGRRGERGLTLLAATPALAGLGGDVLSRFGVGQVRSFDVVVLPGPVARSLGVRADDVLPLQIAGRSRRARVGAVVDPDLVGSLADVPAIFAPLPYAQVLADLPGRISRIYVLAAPGREAEVAAGLRRVAAGSVDVRPADSDARVFEQSALPNQRSLTLFAAIGAFVGFLFAFNAMLVMMGERRRTITDLRMSGYGFRAILQVLVFDAVVLGVAGSVAGLLLGDLLSRHVFEPDPGYLAIAFPVGGARTVEWQTVLLALASGTLAALAAMVPPLMAAARAPAIDLGEDPGLRLGSGPRWGLGGWRLPASLACLGVGVAVLLAAPDLALLGMGALVASMLLALPALLSLALVGLDRARRSLRGVVGPIALGELRSSGGRSVAIAAVAAIAVFSTTSIGGSRMDLQRGLDHNSRELYAIADLWITPPGTSKTLATAPFRPGDARRRVAALPAVERVDVHRASFLDVGDRRVWVMAPPSRAPRPFPPTQVVEGDFETAAARVRAGGWAVVSEGVADDQGLAVGEPIGLGFARPLGLRLAAITTNFGWSPGTIVMNADDYRRAWGSARASSLHVDLRGVSPAAGRRLVQDALGPNHALEVETVDERAEGASTVSRDGLARLAQISALVLIAAVLAIATAVGAMIWERRRTLAELKLSGIGRRSLWRALLLESALLIGAGCAVGAAYGILGQQLLDRALRRVTGLPVEESLGLGVALLSLVIVTAVATAMAMLPGWLATRVPPEAALGD